MEICPDRTADETSQFSGSQPLGFKLVGDNVDKTVKARYMRMDRYSNKSLHYFHCYAVLNRIQFNLPDESPVLSESREIARSLLPSPVHDEQMQAYFVIIISRILYSNMDYFKVSFDSCVKWHIEHKYYQQMCKKSHVVRLYTYYYCAHGICY